MPVGGSRQIFSLLSEMKALAEKFLRENVSPALKSTTPLPIHNLNANKGGFEANSSAKRILVQSMSDNEMCFDYTAVR